MTYELQAYKTDQFPESNIVIMDEIPPYDKEDYDLLNPKQFKKYIDDIERVCRASMEYREFIQYLRKYMDMNKCAFFKNVTNADTTKIKIHLHHHPFTLYDIAIIVYSKRQANGESLEVEMVAKEVMYIHYYLYIGLVPLAETAHELVHNQLLFVPLNIVLGKFYEFKSMYEKYIPDEILERFHTYEELTAKYDEITNTAILRNVPIYLKLPGSDPDGLGSYGLPKLASLVGAIKDNLTALSKQDVKGLIVDTTYDSNTAGTELIKPFEIITEPIKPFIYN